jgi:hypothetical protein
MAAGGLPRISGATRSTNDSRKKMPSRRFRFSTTLWLIALLAACGGSRTDSPEADFARSATAKVSPPSIKSFSPAQASIGATVTVDGSSLKSVTAAKVGAISASFVIDSDKKLRLIVPAGATTGRIEVANGSASALSKSDLVIDSAIKVTSVTPSTVLAPARINVAGSQLDLVRQARLGGTWLAIAGQSASSLALDVPLGASTGYLTLVDAAGASTTTAFLVTVASPMTIGSLSPAAVARGAPLTIGGTHLDRAASVKFAGEATAPIASKSGTTSITVTVPLTAVSGPITVNGNLGDSVVSAASVTVLVPITVDANASYSLPSVPSSLTIPGSGLLAVTGATVGSTATTITAKSDSAVTFTVPAGVQCGSITLLSASQPAVAAGHLTVGAGCAARSAGIEFAQVLSQAPADSLQRLVPGKTTMVRAYVVSDVTGTAAPAVQLTAFNGSSPLGTIPMTGPATLPQLAAGLPVPDGLRYDESRTFNAILPTSWVAAGLRVRIDIGSSASAEATPQIGTSTQINLVLVPLVSGPNVPSLPSVASVVDELARRLTLPRESINVSLRAPYTVSSTADGIDTSTEWSNVLAELENLRRKEAPSKHYYGFVKPMVSAGIAGIGYINFIGAGTPSLSAMGWDGSRASWAKTFVHELGHNFSRRHAPCGGASGADVNYPYPGGALSATPLYESIANRIQSPANQYDIMGYCNGVWFSDYNLREVQRFMEAQPQSAGNVAGTGFDAGGELIVVAGRIDAEGVSLEPVQRKRGAATAAAFNGDYRLRLQLASGEAVEVPVDVVEVDHVDEKHFYAALPAPGPLARIDVLRRGRAVALRADGRMRAQAATVAAAEGPSVQWSERGNHLELSWNSETYGAADLVHVADSGERTVLGLNLRGGSARIDVARLPRGGSFELSVSSGLDAQLLVLKR